MYLCIYLSKNVNQQLTMHVDAWLQWWLSLFVFSVMSFFIAQYVQWCRSANQILWWHALFSVDDHILQFLLQVLRYIFSGAGAVQRYHWQITNMSESTNFQGLCKSFENSTYSYPSLTIIHLSPSSLCYPWSSSHHPSNHITVYLIFTSHMLYHHPSSHMLLVVSFHVSKPSQQTNLIHSTSRLTFHFNPSSHLFIPLFI